MDLLIIIKLLFIFLLILNVFFWTKETIISIKFGEGVYVKNNSYQNLYIVICLISAAIDLIIMITSIIMLFFPDNLIQEYVICMLITLITASILRFGLLMFKLGYS